MVKSFVSPGVYAIERDFSYYVANVGQTSLGLVGETVKGPANKAIRVTNYSQFRDMFGGHDTNLHVSYCAERWFKFGDAATIVRVLGNEQFINSAFEQLIYLTCSGSGEERIFAVLLTSGWNGQCAIQTGQTIVNSSFGFTAGTIFSGNITLSDTNSPYYIDRLFRRDYTGFASNVLVTLLSLPGASSGFTTYSAHTGTVASTPFSIGSYSNASTPMIVSDIIVSGSTGRNLFTLYTISDGINSNSQIKIAIEDIDMTANTFDVVIRDFGDRFDRQIVLERFTKLSMTKSATTYIGKMIGDSVDDTGEFTLISKYVYVTVEPGDHSGLLPMGFGRITAPAFNNRKLLEFPIKQLYDSSVPISRQMMGIDDSKLDRDHVMANYAAQWNQTVASGALAQKILGYHLNFSASATEYARCVESVVGIQNVSNEKRKFQVPVLGGRDGWLRREKYRTLLATAPSTNVVTSYQTAINVLSNPEDVDINLLAVPGVSLVSSIGTYALTMIEERADALYIADFPDNITTAAQATAQITSLDSSYGATYWPYVQFYDVDNSSYVWKPATCHILEVIAYTDNVSDPWWAPAGLNRGMLTTVTKAKYKLTAEDRETLYDGRVNPIATFPTQGITVWGQKTLQIRTTSLDRINVRRMVLYAKKVIAGATKYLVFEQNDQATWDRFKAMVNPVLDTIKIKRGLIDFRVVMDESTNTPDIVDRNQMVGYIYLKPTKSAEIITIYFTLLPQGATFEE
jgi:phage tail sheath protein FI